MGFDLASAAPVSASRFDLASAQPMAPTLAKAPVTGAQRANAVPTGFNAGVAGLAGLPMDTAANVVDLGKAAIGTGYHAITGKPIPQALEVDSDRSNLPGSGDYLRKLMNKVPGKPAEIPRPDDTASRFLYAAGTAVPAALTATPATAGQAVRAVAANAIPALAGQGATEIAPESPNARMAATLLAQASPRGAGSMASAATRAVQSAEGDAIAAARTAGYKITPKEANQPVGAAIEGLAGSAALERSVSKQNQAVSNGLARKEIGLSGNTPIKPSELSAVRKNANQAYDDLAKSGRIQADDEFAQARDQIGGNRSSQTSKDFPEDVNPEIERMKAVFDKPEFDAQSAIQKTRQLRAHASKNIRSDDPAKTDLGYAQKDMADAFDAMLERHAASLGQPELAQRFQDARVQLAKVHTVEDALNETTGNIQAPELGKMLERGSYLSGGLKTIAQTARAAPKSVQSTEKLSNQHMLGSAFDLGLGAIGGAVGTAGVTLGHGPLAPAAFMLATARPATRALLRSNAYQRPGPGAPSSERQLSYLTQLSEMSPEDRRKAIAQAMNQ